MIKCKAFIRHGTAYVWCEDGSEAFIPSKYLDKLAKALDLEIVIIKEPYEKSLRKH